MKQFKITNSFTNRGNRSIADILLYISQHPYDRIKEEQTYERLLQHDESAKEDLITNNLSFALSVAKSFESTKVPVEDLFQEACKGLVIAANKFDASKGLKFITYSIWWIRQSILDSLQTSKTNIVVPNNVALHSQKALNVINKFAQENGYFPSNDELVDLLNLSKDVIEALLYFLTRTGLRLSDEIPGTDNLKYEDYLEEESCADDFINDEHKKYLVKGLLAKLPKNHQLIIKAYFGINCETKNIDTIAIEVNLTRERVRQIIKRDLLKLKKYHIFLRNKTHHIYMLRIRRYKIYIYRYKLYLEILHSRRIIF